MVSAVGYFIVKKYREKAQLQKEIEDAFLQKKISLEQCENLRADLKKTYRINLVRLRMLNFIDDHKEKA